MNKRKTSIEHGFLDALHCYGTVHGNVTSEERGPCTLEYVHDIHTLAHEVVFEHSVRTGISLGSLRGGKTELSPG